jgi:hypothetical protein
MGGSGSLVDFLALDLEAGVDSRVSTRSRRLENASRTVASLLEFGFAGTRAGESQPASWCSSYSILAIAASRSSQRVVVLRALAV